MLPIAALCGIAISAAVYLLMNIAYFAVITREEFLQTNAVAVVRMDSENHSNLLEIRRENAGQLLLCRTIPDCPPVAGQPEQLHFCIIPVLSDRLFLISQI